MPQGSVLPGCHLVEALSGWQLLPCRFIGADGMSEGVFLPTRIGEAEELPGQRDDIEGRVQVKVGVLWGAGRRGGGRTELSLGADLSRRLAALTAYGDHESA